MVCLSLGYRDLSLGKRDDRAIEHRTFVAEYIRHWNSGLSRSPSMLDIRPTRSAVD